MISADGAEEAGGAADVEGELGRHRAKIAEPASAASLVSLSVVVAAEEGDDGTGLADGVDLFGRVPCCRCRGAPR